MGLDTSGILCTKVLLKSQDKPVWYSNLVQQRNAILDWCQLSERKKLLNESSDLCKPCNFTTTRAVTVKREQDQRSDKYSKSTQICLLSENYKNTRILCDSNLKCVQRLSLTNMSKHRGGLTWGKPLELSPGIGLSPVNQQGQPALFDVVGLTHGHRNPYQKWTRSNIITNLKFMYPKLLQVQRIGKHSAIITFFSA